MQNLTLVTPCKLSPGVSAGYVDFTYPSSLYTCQTDYFISQHNLCAWTSSGPLNVWLDHDFQNFNSSGLAKILKGIWSLDEMKSTHKIVREAERRLECLCWQRECLWSLHLPPCGINSNGSWLTEVTVEKCPPPASICSGHWDGLVSRVRPIDILMNPVYCQSFRRVQLAVYQNHLLSCVTRFVYVGTAKTGLVTGLTHGTESAVHMCVGLGLRQLNAR